MVLVSAVTCLAVLHNLGSVGIGTIIAAVLAGTVVGIITKAFGKQRDKILGKPSDEEDALDTLLKLQGKSHQVYTGVTLLVKEQGIWKPYTFSERTDVEFYPVSREELLAYIETGEPMDKAGSYGIQGGFGIYVKGICGDYNNVVGLPVGRLVYELKKLGIDIRGIKK